MKQNSKFNWPNWMKWFIIVVAIVGLCLFIFQIPEFWPQALAIIVSAFGGAGVTVWLTQSLLVNQTSAEEVKDKNIKTHQSKLDTYSVFISKMWEEVGKFGDDPLNAETLEQIRRQIFDKLIFHLNKKDIEAMIACFKNLDKPNEDGGKGIRPIPLCAELTGIVKNNLDMAEDNSDSKKGRISKEISHNTESNPKEKTISDFVKDLWVSIDVVMQKLNEQNQKGLETPQPSTREDANEALAETIGEAEQATDNTNETDPNEKNKYPFEFNQTWHFAMWGDKQLEYIGDGKENELSLAEYGEEWRTNLVKQVGENDVVFLFRRGGDGYLGAFRPLGWRVFEYNKEDDTCVETIHMFGQEERTVQGEEASKDSDKYDIYECRADGADLCANLIVEPIAYTEKGVGNPGGVYRRTISRYDRGYAATLLQRLKQFEKNN